LRSFQALQSVGLVTGMMSMSSFCNRELPKNVKNTISLWFTSHHQSRTQTLSTNQCWLTEHPLQKIAIWTTLKSLPPINKFWLFVKRVSSFSFLDEAAICLEPSTTGIAIVKTSKHRSQRLAQLKQPGCSSAEAEL
jgi:hypothetical protein